MYIALIITIGLVPAMVSLWIGLRSHSQLQNSLHLANDYAARDRFRRFSVRPRDPDEHFVEGMGLVIGDITCQLNARSSYIRCAANPSGPCEGCLDYEGKDYPPLSTAP